MKHTPPNPDRHQRGSGGESEVETARELLYNDRSMIETTRDQVVEAMRRHHYPRASVFAVRLALEEAISNAFRHGHAALESDEPVEVDWRVDPRTVRVSVQDHGPGFRPETVPDPTEAGRLDIPSGRGLMLIRAYMTSVRFNKKGNRIDMVYERPDPDDD